SNAYAEYAALRKGPGLSAAYRLYRHSRSAGAHDGCAHHRASRPFDLTTGCASTSCALLHIVASAQTCWARFTTRSIVAPNQALGLEIKPRQAAGGDEL